jgi:DNA-binding MarR family transcriptional regulator
MGTTTPDLPFGTQLIGRTEKSLDALLKRTLAGSGLSQPEYVALRVCSDRSGEQRADITAQLGAAFRKGEDHAAELVERLDSAGMINTDQAAAVELSPAGRELHDRLVAETDAIAARLWGDLPSADLAVAARVLSTVLRRTATERA